MNLSSRSEVQTTFWEHVEELRGRVFKAVVAFGVGTGVAWYFRESVLVWLTTPFVHAWSQSISEQRPALHFPAPAALFLAYLQLSLMAGLVFALPIILHQIWSFVAPGLRARERRFAVPFVFASAVLFLAGGYLGWKFAFPAAFRYLLEFSGSLATDTVAIAIKPTVMIEDYIEFTSRMLLAFGLIFELPVLVFFLSSAGVIDHTHLIKFARYFVVLSFFVAAIVTPPDIMSQFLLAIPLCLLYALSIGIAWVMGRSKPGAAA
jgi:sec-independent protein translocase protein TatC